MAAVFADEAHVAATYRAACATGSPIAAVNGPEETVISGDAAALAEVLAALRRRRASQSRALEVSHAFHSPRLDPMLDALERRAAAVAARRAAHPARLQPHRHGLPARRRPRRALLAPPRARAGALRGVPSRRSARRGRHGAGRDRARTRRCSRSPRRAVPGA